MDGFLSEGVLTTTIFWHGDAVRYRHPSFADGLAIALLERHQRAKMVVVKTPSERKPSIGKSIRNLSTVTRVGLDLAKSVFQVHAVDAKNEVWRKLTRSQLIRWNWL